MATLKCLSLPRWCTWDDDDALDCFKHREYKEIHPTIEKPGWYSHRGCEWYEVMLHGKLRAFEAVHPGQHAYELSLENHKPLTQREIQLIKSWLLYRWNKELATLLYVNDQWVMIRDIRREQYKYRGDLDA